MNRLRLGFALCGSYCTYDKAVAVASRLAQRFDITPIFSENAASTDTRFGKAADFVARLEGISGNSAIKTIAAAEPIGPGALLDVLLIAPCTGNTLSKLANGITDTSVTMAAKAQLRNLKPVVLALATNDGLSGSAKNLGALLGRKNIYFVPFGQDDAAKKPTSLNADFELCELAVEAALRGEQLQPVLVE